jgi:hypothetical protein
MEVRGGEEQPPSGRELRRQGQDPLAVLASHRGVDDEHGVVAGDDPDVGDELDALVADDGHPLVDAVERAGVHYGPVPVCHQLSSRGPGRGAEPH